MKSIRVYDLATGKFFEEKVYGGIWIQLLYRFAFLRRLLLPILTRREFSRFFGYFQGTSWSRFRIRSFVRRYRIRVDEFEPGPYQSFNDFFARSFKKDARLFVDEMNFPAPAEARYFALDSVKRTDSITIKGELLSLESLLLHPKWCEVFDEGPMLIARLCPVDYHRFHFPDSGRFEEFYRLHGAFNSVNPWAIAAVPKVLSTNERTVSILETEHFGRVAYVEVGAMMVGKIIQTHVLDQRFGRGSEKGYFHFGASTVILIGEKGRWKPDETLLKNTSDGIETYVKLGQRVGYGQV